MKPLTREWVEKTEGDFATARREGRVRKAPNYDAVCYHAQQCAEKYLKACLQEADMPFGRTHNLPALLDLLLVLDPDLDTLRAHSRALTVFAVDVRYPGSRWMSVILASQLIKRAHWATGRGSWHYAMGCHGRSDLERGWG